jgi:hypothetical protein
MNEVLGVYNTSTHINLLWDNFTDSSWWEAMRVVNTSHSSAVRQMTGFLNKNYGTWIHNKHFWTLSHTNTRIKLNTLTPKHTYEHKRDIVCLLISYECETRVLLKGQNIKLGYSDAGSWHHVLLKTVFDFHQEGSMVLSNAGIHLQDCTVSKPRALQHEQSPLCKSHTVRYIKGVQIQGVKKKGRLNCVVRPLKCPSPVYEIYIVCAVLVPRILRWLLGFWKVCEPCPTQIEDHW